MNSVIKLPTKHAVIVFFLWAFAPVAWYLLWRDKRFHSWFPKLLWLNGLIFGIIFLTQSFIVVPKLNQLYEVLGIQIPPFTHPTAILLVILFAIAQIGAGLKLEKLVRKDKKLVDRYLAAIIVIFAIDGALGIATGLLTRITPAYFIKDSIPSVITEQVQKVLPTFTPSPLPVPVTIPVATPTPTPRPLTFAQMNKQFGPCVYLPTLMYHHIQDIAEAKKLGHAGLAVAPSMFAEQMEYLSKRGYQTVDPSALISFFETGSAITPKSIMISFDDGYDDFYTQAFPILKQHNFKSILFLPTGLVGNPGYLTWDQIREMQNSGLVLFANHTWSHKSMSASSSEVAMEITTADTELLERNLGNPKVFAYPYGTVGVHAQMVLKTTNYKLAFTTHAGATLCKQQALTLPRVRIGNGPLSSYGF